MYNEKKSFIQKSLRIRTLITPPPPLMKIHSIIRLFNVYLIWFLISKRSEVDILSFYICWQDLSCPITLPEETIEFSFNVDDWDESPLVLNIILVIGLSGPVIQNSIHRTISFIRVQHKMFYLILNCFIWLKQLENFQFVFNLLIFTLYLH